MKCTMRILFYVGLSVTASSLVINEAAESSARIVNGYEVNITEVPYQVSLRRRAITSWVHICGAVIVRNRAILTAAHCVEDFILDPILISIVVGTNSRTSGGDMYQISKIFIHELYSRITMFNDIALLGTARDILIGPSVLPISIAPLDFQVSDGTEATVSGFGSTSFEGFSSPVLLAARVQIVNQDLCLQAYQRIATVTPEMICASAGNPARDACQGDSGGPLVANNHLVGIVSWGEGCASEYPGVYTRVSRYSGWIQNKIDQVYIN